MQKKRVRCAQSKFPVEKEERLNEELKGRHIVFVAHEFGIFPGNGGIASYLYQLTGYILEHYTNVKVSVLTCVSDPKCDLLKKKSFACYLLPGGDLQQKGRYVLDKLKKIKPDYVEVAEYQGLCLESLVYRLNFGRELRNTKFFVDNHTASRECFEWSTELPFALAGIPEKYFYIREYAQMLLADKNISPSDFLTDYVKKRYRINDIETVRHPVNFKIEKKENIRAKVSEKMDISAFDNKFVVSCITRFEGRKKQNVLIRAFISFLENTGADAYLILAGNTSVDLVKGGDVRQKYYENVPIEYRDRIKFYDFVSGGQKEWIYALTDVAVMASVYENYPVAMTEYVFKGVPVIASAFSGCADFMKQMGDITTFNPFVEGDLSAKMCQFYKISAEDKKKIAKEQLEELLCLSEPGKAVYEKLRYFSSFECIRNLKNSEKNNTLKFLTDKELRKKVEKQGKRSIVLSTEGGKTLSRKMLRRYEKIQDKRYFVYAFGKVFGLSIVEALCESEIIYVPEVVMTENDVGKYWYEVLAARILEREDGYVFFPLPDEQLETVSFEPGKYKLLIDEIFMQRNMNDLEELYEA